MSKNIARLFLCFLLVSSFLAADLSSFAKATEDKSSVARSAEEELTLEDLITNLQSNQSKIKDLYAETVTTITSNIAMPGAKDKGPQKMVQKGKMWTKGKDKSKIEMLSPMKQTTITNGDQMAIINPETGQKMVQDLKKLKGQGALRQSSGQASSKGQEGMNLEKAKEYFDLSLSKKGDDYVIIGIPKEANKFLGKMEFYVDPEKWVPTKILMYSPSVASAKEGGPKDKLMSQSEIEYKEFSVSYSEAPSAARSEGVWVPVKNISNISTPAGKMSVEMEFENVKVNKGMSDKEFKIE